MRKKIIFIVFLCFIFNISFSQNSMDSSITNLPENCIYIIDSMQQIRSPKRYQMTSDINYLQIYDNYAVLTYTCRQKSTYTSGKLTNPIQKIFDTDTVNIFTLISDNRFPASVSGNRVFIGISKNFNVNHKLYLLNQPKQPEFYLISHIASKKEEEYLRSKK